MLLQCNFDYYTVLNCIFASCSSAALGPETDRVACQHRNSPRAVVYATIECRDRHVRAMVVVEFENDVIRKKSSSHVILLCSKTPASIRGCSSIMHVRLGTGGQDIRHARILLKRMS